MQSAHGMWPLHELCSTVPHTSDLSLRRFFSSAPVFVVEREGVPAGTTIVDLCSASTSLYAAVLLLMGRCLDGTVGRMIRISSVEHKEFLVLLQIYRLGARALTCVHRCGRADSFV